MFQRCSLILLSAIALTGCTHADAARSEAPADKSIAVKVAPVATGVIQSEVVLTGDIRPAAETEVATKVSGRLLALGADEGRQVKRGQVLARLDPRDATLQLQQAQSALRVAESARRSAETNLAHLRDTETRIAALAAEGGVSVQQMNDVRFQTSSALNALQTADAQVAQARVTVAAARASLDDTVVRAPFDGVVTKKLVEMGTTLGPITPILILATTQTLELKVPVGQATLSDIRLGQQGSFTVSTFPGRAFRATVSEVAPTIDATNRASGVTLRIANTDGRLAPGMFARLTLPTARHEGATILPASAVINDGEKSIAFVCQKDRALRRELTLGIKNADRVEVLSGVEPGEAVVTVGQAQLEDGDRLAVQP